MTAWLVGAMTALGTRAAVERDDQTISYADLVRRIEAWRRGPLASLSPGAVVAFDGAYGPGAISLLLALGLDGHIAVPLSHDVAAHHATFMALGEAEYRVRGIDDSPDVSATGVRATHGWFRRLRERRSPGLVLFSSGSTGAHKAAVHDLSLLLGKFRTTRPGYRTLGFLQLDHIGGLNTLCHTLANGGTLIVPPRRTASAVCATIERHRVELLPVSPTFLNLLLLSEEHRHRDLTSLRLITYGTEPMPASTLRRVTDTFPGVRLLQTYGLSELGILRSQSRHSDSLWVRVGGEGFETKVIEGRLWIRATSAMLGYLNAPSPFDADGYFDTGDLVDVDGEWIRFAGRHSDVINVGGSKVFPAEVESVLLEMDNVADVSVHGESSPITGHVVTATVRLVVPEAPEAFKLRMRRFCASRLSTYQVPLKVRVNDGPLHSTRFKRRRSAS